MKKAEGRASHDGKKTIPQRIDSSVSKSGRVINRFHIKKV
ncbi:hypothetical protein HMPREF1985_00184 [Mitsuokella sp. oral taxon 131 str. W9106]|nr:hypothetical protein HMPREF1985_00184 [Mitsuokella sp. oral taxon 131 str. W9106]